MSSRRSLLSRQNRETASPHVQRPRQSTALPPYEPPAAPLTQNAQRALAEISANHDYRKYQKHLDVAISSLTKSAGESHDRVYMSKEKVRRMAEKREATDEDAEKTEAEERAEVRAKEMEDKVERLTTEAENALRELIDYKQELAQQEDMLKKVSEEAVASSASAAVAASASRDRNRAARESRRIPTVNSDDEDADYGEAADAGDVDMEDAAAQTAILSPAELLKKAKEDYESIYTSKSLRSRYAEHNDYIGFKRVIHDARNPGENAPPVPHPSTWFPADLPSNAATARRRRMASNTDNTENGDDDDVQMTGVVSSLKCPLTLQTFKEPYSNRICKHTFEKSAILEFHHQNAIAFVDPSQGGRRGRGAPLGPKQLKCPERGCDAMLEVKDFYIDQMILRQVKRQAEKPARYIEDDIGEEDVVIPGTQPNKPQELDDSSLDIGDYPKQSIKTTIGDYPKQSIKTTIGDHPKQSFKSERKSQGTISQSQTISAETLESEDEEDGDPEPIEMDD